MKRIPVCRKIQAGIFSFRLNVGILMGDVLDAGARLQWIQVVVTQDHRLGIARVQFLK